MFPGRKPIPAHLQKVTGVKSRSKFRSANTGTASASKRRLRIPTDLTLDQKKLWQYFAKHSFPGQLQPIDGEVMRMLVVHASLAREYELKLRSSPKLIKTPNGMAIASPYIGLLNRQTDLVLKLLTSLGFTPTERARIGSGSASLLDDDDLEEFDDF